MTDNEYQQSLGTAHLELKLLESTRSVESVSKDEDIRRLRMQLLLLEDENEELHGQLRVEENRGDGLEQAADEALSELEQAEGEIQRLMNESKTKARELESARVCTLLHVETLL